MERLAPTLRPAALAVAVITPGLVLDVDPEVDDRVSQDGGCETRLYAIRDGLVVTREKDCDPVPPGVRLNGTDDGEAVMVPIPVPEFE